MSNLLTESQCANILRLTKTSCITRSEIRSMTIHDYCGYAILDDDEKPVHVEVESGIYCIVHGRDVAICNALAIANAQLDKLEANKAKYL